MRDLFLIYVKNSLSTKNILETCREIVFFQINNTVYCSSRSLSALRNVTKTRHYTKKAQNLNLPNSMMFKVGNSHYDEKAHFQMRSNFVHRIQLLC